MNRTSVAELQAHVERLCDDNHITWHVGDGDGSYAIYELAEIVTPPIRGRVSYSTVLHEIGPILGRYQGEHHRTMTCEVWAWRWARDHALVWTPAMQRHAEGCLAWYGHRLSSGITRAQRKDNGIARWRATLGGC